MRSGCGRVDGDVGWSVTVTSRCRALISRAVVKLRHEKSSGSSRQQEAEGSPHMSTEPAAGPALCYFCSR